ncbi:nuclear transport factor 2 family protein [Actinomadura rubrisoli]|uniref:Nuclear transport factor 2 family protein n=1 Tax=Actinomadura rubrisoli TaxID=2530368 RepID=A0A4R5BC67_9ACTN|nr:nuclear transport factor 2 family protein [Actinomadura rubrisoli]TDD82286.1 nuclear transport factor 2 family protein [Actinomadura rubrisoli]
MNYENFVERYVAVWTETDPETRRKMIPELWAEDGVEYIENAEYRGHEAIEARVTAAHDEFFRDVGHVLRAAGDTVAHNLGVRFTIYILPAGGGGITWTGAVFAKLGDDGLIEFDYQFGDPPSPRVP